MYSGLTALQIEFPFCLTLCVSKQNTLVFNCNCETKDCVLVWCYMYGIKEPFSFLMHFALHKLLFFYFIRQKEYMRIGLPAGWSKVVREGRWFMKCKCVLLINFRFFIYIFDLISIYDWFLSLFRIPSVLWI